MIRTYGLTHLQIAVRDLGRSGRFYRRVFGMKVLFRVGRDMVMLGTPGARDVFTLNRSKERVRNAGRQGGIAHFGFRLRKAGDLGPALEAVRANGGTVLRQGERGPRDLYAFVNDPDGYVIEIFHDRKS